MGRPRSWAAHIVARAAILAAFYALFLGAIAFVNASSASARPYGITCGHKQCTMPKHKHHHHRGCRKHGHRPCKHSRHPKTKCFDCGHTFHPKPKPEHESRACETLVVRNGTVVTEKGHCEVETEGTPVCQTNSTISGACPPIEKNPCEMPGSDCNGNPCEYAVIQCKEAPEEPFEVKGLEVYQLVFKELPAVPSSIWASVEVTYPQADTVSTVFYAEYGSFPKVYIGYGAVAKPGTLTPNRFSEYVPCPEKVSPDGYDTAWVVVYDHTTGKYVESEHVKFNIAEPEHVRIANPAG